MSGPRILAIDVGTGTQDILVFEAGTVIENAVQLIMPSPTALLAEQVRQATVEGTDLFLTGVTMGGGPDHWAVEAHLRKGLKVYATPDAARTFDDDLTRVEAMGLRIVDGPDGVGGARRLEMRDFYFSELMDALKSFHVSTVFDAVAVAVFDHGAAPPGVSDRRFRFDYLREQVERGIGLTGFGFLAAEIPARMTRMRAVAPSIAPRRSARRHDADRLLWFAASAGASAPRAWACHRRSIGRPGAAALKQADPKEPPSVLRDGMFLRFWSGSSISTLGNQVTVIALPWLVLQLETKRI